MDEVEAWKFGAIVVKSVSHTARSIHDLDRIAERVVDESDTELHIISERFEILPNNEDSFQKAMLRLLGVFAELEADMA